MSGVRCFFLQPTDRMYRDLRRYASGSNCPFPGGHGYHNAHEAFDIAPVVLTERGCIGEQQHPSHDDPRWPRQCVCGYVFAGGDTWQVFTSRIYRRQDTGEEMTLRSAPPGAMYDASWYPEEWRGPDGMALIVKLPDGHAWHVDGRCSNCTRPDDKKHKCWVRHGVPPLITVDKDGDTCSAGAGSIQTPKWHGFLRNGILE